MYTGPLYSCRKRIRRNRNKANSVCASNFLQQKMRLSCQQNQLQSVSPVMLRDLAGWMAALSESQFSPIDAGVDNLSLINPFLVRGNCHRKHRGAGQLCWIHQWRGERTGLETRRCCRKTCNNCQRRASPPPLPNRTPFSCMEGRILMRGPTRGPAPTFRLINGNHIFLFMIKLPK